MRRLKGFVLSGASFGMVARLAGIRTISVKSPIPESATFFTSFFCHERNAFVCVFEDESFDRVAEGGLIPIAEGPTITELDQQLQDDPTEPKPAMQYNTCKTCLAFGGRAGLLFNGECENCYRTRESGTVSILTNLHRTEAELQRTMKIPSIHSVEKSTKPSWPEVERNLSVFDPLTDTCETAFEKWIRAGQKVGKHVGDEIRFELWVVWRTAWDCSQKVSPDASLPEEDDTESIEVGELRLLRKVFETSSDLVKANWSEEFRDASGGMAALQSAHAEATAELERWFNDASEG